MAKKSIEGEETLRPRWIWNDRRVAILREQAPTHTAKEIKINLGARSVRTIYDGARLRGIELMGSNRGGPTYPVDLSKAELDVLKSFAAKRGLDRIEMLQRGVSAMLADPVLFANILDDMAPA